MSLYLGIDLGTQSVKALLYDADARAIVATSSAGLELISRDNGSREQLAQWWLDALHKCLLDLPVDLRRAVAAMGVSGQQHGFVPLGENGEVLAPVKLWCDTSTTAECEQIMANFGGVESCISQLGNPILAGYTASKIRHLKNTEPAHYQCMRHILLPHDYINYYLSGELAMEAGDASGTGLLDIRKREWHRGMLAAVDADRNLADCLPALVSADACIGRVRIDIAEQLGLPAGIPIAAGGGDNMMAAIGTGNVVAGRTTVSLGTSGTLFAYADQPVIDSTGGIAAFCSSTGGWLPLLCTMNCTVATEQARDLFALASNDIEALAGEAPIGSEGLVTVPFYNGERNPNLPRARASLMGLDTSNFCRANVLRSAMEAATYALRAGMDLLVEQGCSSEAICLTGGGARNGLWRQMVADIFDAPVRVLEQDEGAAMGAALQALWMQGSLSGSPLSIGEIVDVHLRYDDQRTCDPQAGAVDQYREHYQNYQRHVAHMTPLYS